MTYSNTMSSLKSEGTDDAQRGGSNLGGGEGSGAYHDYNKGGLGQFSLPSLQNAKKEPF